MMKLPRSSLTSRCSCDKSIIVEYDPCREFRTKVLFTGCLLDKPITSTAASCPCVHKHALKVNAASTADHDASKDGDVDGVERDLQGVCLQERMNLAPRGVCNHTPRAALGRTDSACSSNRPEESQVVSQHNRLFQLMQKLRMHYLAELWAILREFKGQLEVFLHDGPVAVIIRYHIDILQRMIAPMVAERKMLVSWLTEETVEQLGRQTLQYVGTFEGEKFQSAFQQLVSRQTRWIDQGQAEQPADCIPPDHSEDKYGGTEDNEPRGHVVALSKSGKDPDPIANNVSAKMASFKGGHGLSARREAAFGPVERSYNDGRDLDISSECLAERDFCPPQCKRLKTMNMREVEFRQEAEDGEATVINRESGNELFGAKPDDFVRSVGQHAPYTSTGSQAVGVAESRDTQNHRPTSFKKFIRLFNGSSASLPCLKSLYEGIFRRSWS